MTLRTAMTRGGAWLRAADPRIRLLVRIGGCLLLFLLGLLVGFRDFWSADLRAARHQYAEKELRLEEARERNEKARADRKQARENALGKTRSEITRLESEVAELAATTNQLGRRKERLEGDLQLVDEHLAACRQGMTNDLHEACKLLDAQSKLLKEQVRTVAAGLGLGSLDGQKLGDALTAWIGRLDDSIRYLEQAIGYERKQQRELEYAPPSPVWQEWREFSTTPSVRILPEFWPGPGNAEGTSARNVPLRNGDVSAPRGVVSELEGGVIVLKPMPGFRRTDQDLSVTVRCGELSVDVPFRFKPGLARSRNLLLYDVPPER